MFSHVKNDFNAIIAGDFFSVRVARYNDSNRLVWDDFVSKSSNATFLHFRNYIEYHSDRFVDHSLLFFSDQGNINCVLPANESNQELISHQGLTYGGFLFPDTCSFEKLRTIYEVLINYLKVTGFKIFHFKPVPNFYCNQTQEADQYLMWRLGASVSALYLNSVVCQKSKNKFSKNRLEGVRKFQRSNGEMICADDFSEFWENLDKELSEKYGTKPVHSLEEINLLRSRFPKNILLYTVRDQFHSFLGGAVLYVSKNVVHVQYISSTLEGRARGALDFLFDKLINETFSHIPYFDFGNSNEASGQLINRKLLFQKEGFGAEPRVQYVWRLTIDKLAEFPEDLLA